MMYASFLSDLWKQNRYLISLVGVLLIANITAFCVQSWVFDAKLLDLRSQVREDQQSLRQMQQQKSSGSMPVSTVKRVEDELLRFHNMIPQEQDLSDFIGELFDFANKTKLDIKRVSYSAGNEEGLNLTSYDLSFSVSGQYRQLKQFIHLLERAGRILIISDIGMSGGAGKKQKIDDVTLNIKVKTYFHGVDK